jgi:hypothetical protein
VTTVVVGAGAAAASTRALPGDTLYGLKRQVENVQLTLAQGDVGRGRELLEQADARLGEAEALAAGEDSTAPQTRDRLAGALADMDAAVTAAADDLTRAYRETGDEEPLLLLDRFVAEQRERLDDLMQLLDPSLRERAATIEARLAVLDREVSALLGTAIGESAASALARDAQASGDGWAAGRIHHATTATSGTGVRGSTGTGVEDVVGAVGGVSSGGAPVSVGGSTGGAGGSGGTVGDLVGGGSSAGTSTAPRLPSVGPTALPTVPVVPLPTPSVRVTVPVGPLTTVAPPTVAPAPLPSVSVCVPVPPLTSC